MGVPTSDRYGRLGGAIVKPNKAKGYICTSFYLKGLWVLGFLRQPNLRGERSHYSHLSSTQLFCFAFSTHLHRDIC